MLDLTRLNLVMDIISMIFLSLLLLSVVGIILAFWKQIISFLTNIIKG